ncbi:MAG TPA: tetratricopeptide repeat protein [Thermoanaerobaculia bacterium]|nr:tetratricopeptide repeat protein [Thermoanaerobaculia bacterium]
MRKTLFITPLLLLLCAGVALADADWDAGVVAFQAGKFSEAVTSFQKYVEKVPDAYQGHQMLGQALLRTKQYGPAATHLQKADELKGGDAQIQLALGQALLLGGKTRDACGVLGGISESALTDANRPALFQLRAKAECGGSGVAALEKLAQSQNTGAAWAAYGAAAINAGELASGISALDKATQLAPNDAKIRRTHVNALKQLARSSRGAPKTAAYNKAIASAQKLVQVENSYDSLLLLGEVQLGAKKYADAVPTLKKAAAQKPGDWLPLLYLGQAETQLDRFAAAIVPLEKAAGMVSTPQDRKSVYSALGFVYEKQKMYDQAIKHYQQAGDSTSVARVQQNKETEEYNQSVEEHNEMVEELKRQKQALEAELKELEEPPPF